jgi:hypothetical protein
MTTTQTGEHRGVRGGDIMMAPYHEQVIHDQIG